jgi:hypothetical protein
MPAGDAEEVARAYVWRPVLARVVVALFSAAMASHVLERLVTIPAPKLKLLAVCRLFVSALMFSLYIRYRRDDRDARTN